MQSKNKFKQCPKCKKWFSIEDFIKADEIQPIGMKMDNNTFALNLYFFNHIDNKCNTTFAMRVDEFEEFISEEIPSEILSRTGDCKEHCADLKNLIVCNNECTYAPYRRFLMKLIENRHKEAIPVDLDY